MNRLVRSAAIVTVLSATVLGACRKKQPAATPTPTPTTTVNQDSIDAAPRRRRSRARRLDRRRERCP
jgi:hypothetical protein